MNRGRLQLVLLVAVCVVPMLLATLMYRLQFWVPDSRTYHGVLIGNGLGRADLGITIEQPRWQLLVTTPGDCAQACRQLVYLARQVHLGLGREAGRVSHGLATGRPLEDARWLADYPHLQCLPLALQRYRQVVPDDGRAWLWIVDPHGNLVLRYDAAVPGREVLHDLQHLLKLSNIG